MRAGANWKLLSQGVRLPMPCAAGLMTGGTGVFLPAQQASRRRSLPVGGLPSALPGGYMAGAQQLNYLQVAHPCLI